MDMSAQMIDHQEAVKNLMAERYLLGELNAGEREAYEEHLFSCNACFEQVKAGTEFIGHLRQMGADEKAGTEFVSYLQQIGAEGTVNHWGFSRLRRMGAEEPVAVAQPRWSQLIYRAFRPSAALAFAVLFFCAAGVNVRQAMVIHRLNAPEVVMVTTVKPASRAAEMPISVPRRGHFELRAVFSYERKLQSYTARVVSVSGKEIASVAIMNPETDLQLRLDADKFRDGDYILIVQAIDQTTRSTRVIKQYPFQLHLQG